MLFAQGQLEGHDPTQRLKQHTVRTLPKRPYVRGNASPADARFLAAASFLMRSVCSRSADLSFARMGCNSGSCAARAWAHSSQILSSSRLSIDLNWRQSSASFPHVRGPFDTGHSVDSPDFSWARYPISPAIIRGEGKSMANVNLSGVVKQLRKEREWAQGAVSRIDAALAALGSVSSNGSSRQHTLSPAARRKISLAQKARWAKQKATPRRTMWRQGASGLQPLNAHGGQH